MQLLWSLWHTIHPTHLNSNNGHFTQIMAQPHYSLHRTQTTLPLADRNGEQCIASTTMQRLEKVGETALSDGMLFIVCMHQEDEHYLTSSRESATVGRLFVCVISRHQCSTCQQSKLLTMGSGQLCRHMQIIVRRTYRLACCPCRY